MELVYLITSICLTSAAGSDKGQLVGFDDIEILPVDNALTAEYIEEERGNPGSFIFADTNNLNFLDSEGFAQRLAGTIGSGQYNGIRTQAAFSTINSFIQLHNDELLVADHGNHCIRHVTKSTRNVSTYMGTCTSYLRPTVPNKDRLTAPRSEVVMRLPSAISYREDQNLFYILTYDSMHSALLTFDPDTDVVNFFIDFSSQNVTFTSDMIWSGDRLSLYVTHSHGISRVNLLTKEISIVAGSRHEAAGEDADAATLSGATFSAEISGLRWLIEDRVLVVADYLGNSLIILNLVENHVSYICQAGEKDYNLKAGSLANCTINRPRFVEIINQTIYTSSTVDRRYPSSAAKFLHLKFYVPECPIPETNVSVAFSPPKLVYNYGDEVRVSCPTDLSIMTSYSAITCSRIADPIIANRSLGAWTDPVPLCGLPELRSIFPKSGHVSGGTLVNATGLFPDNMYIILKQNNQKENISFYGDHMSVSFRMPPSERSVSNATLVFIMNTEGNFTFERVFRYVGDPLIESVSRLNSTYSGGLPILLRAQNILSTAAYSLQLTRADNAASTTVNCSIMSKDEVRCILPALVSFTLPSPSPSTTGFPRNRRSNKDEGIAVSGKFLADGSDLQDTISLHYFQDPLFFENNTISMDLTADTLISLPGERLNSSLVLTDYSVRFPEYDNARCIVERLTFDSLACRPSVGLLIPEDEAFISPRIVVTAGANWKSNFNTTFLKLRRPAAVVTTAAPVLREWWIILLVIVLVLIVIAVIGFCIWRKRTRPFDPELSVLDVAFARSARGDLAAKLKIEIKIPLEDMKIDRDSLEYDIMSRPIGQGHFGSVLLGQLKLLKDGRNVYKNVAVKTLKTTQDVDEKMLENFLTEAVFLSGIKRHMNILKPIGVMWAQPGWPVVVLPYMANGDLCTLIKRTDMKLTTGDMLHLALQITCGMEFFSSQQLVHRDLACRNCLVSDDFIVKIADFGLSVDAYEQGYYRESDKEQARPIRWMALESLREYTYTTSTDVWSFGVLMWEMHTRGGIPYPGVANSEILEYLEKGKRLERPTHAHPMVYEKMRSCWNEDPSQRPTFARLHNFLQECLKHHPGRIQCDQEGENYYSYERVYTKGIPSDYLCNKNFTKEEDDLYADRHATSLRDIYAAYGIPNASDPYNDEKVDYRTREKPVGAGYPNPVFEGEDDSDMDGVMNIELNSKSDHLRSKILMPEADEVSSPVVNAPTLLSSNAPPCEAPPCEAPLPYIQSEMSNSQSQLVEPSSDLYYNIVMRPIS